MIGVSPTQISKWRCDPETKTHVEAPYYAVELLRQKIKKGEPDRIEGEHETLNHEFQTLVLRSGLLRREIADMIGLSIDSVHGYMQSPESAGGKPVRKPIVELLTFKLREINRI